MSELLFKLFIKDKDNIKNKEVRKSYGTLSGYVGIVLNALLATAKLIIGTFSGSISVTADAVNNFSDAGSSVISLIGFKLSGKPADYDHPFGHGRIEYISGLIVSFIVLIFGVELLKSSVERIINPTEIIFSIWAIIALTLSILGKIWLAYFNRKIGKKINSASLSAVVADSISDCAATLVTIISMLLAHYFGINIDAYLGCIVAVIIIIAGIKIVKETIDPLIGLPPEPELVNNIKNAITEYDMVLGVHDLIIHNYGSTRIFGSVHVEVPADGNVLEIHEIMDDIEIKLKKEYGIEIVAHTDPVETDNEVVNSKKEIAKEVIKNISPLIDMHDFRIVTAPSHTIYIFDVVLPFSLKITENEAVDVISQKIREKDLNSKCVITVDRDYVGRI